MEWWQLFGICLSPDNGAGGGGSDETTTTTQTTDAGKTQAGATDNGAGATTTTADDPLEPGLLKYLAEQGIDPKDISKDAARKVYANRGTLLSEIQQKNTKLAETTRAWQSLEVEQLVGSAAITPETGQKIRAIVDTAKSFQANLELLEQEGLIEPGVAHILRLGNPDDAKRGIKALGLRKPETIDLAAEKAKWETDFRQRLGIAANVGESGGQTGATNDGKSTLDRMRETERTPNPQRDDAISNIQKIQAQRRAGATK